MKDGLYRVEYKDICAGFVIEGGRVILCPPVLKRRLQFWIRIASWVCGIDDECDCGGDHEPKTQEERGVS